MYCIVLDGSIAARGYHALFQIPYPICKLSTAMGLKRNENLVGKEFAIVRLRSFDNPKEPEIHHDPQS